MNEISNGTWSETDASNNAATPNGWPEGQPPSSVNDCARMMMGAVKRFWSRINGAYATTGSSNAYVLTLAEPLAAYVTGERYSFRANFANTGAATLNISSLGAKAIKKYTSSGVADLASADIQSGAPVTVEYDGTNMIMVSPVAGGIISVADAANGGVAVTNGTGAATIALNVADLSSATPTQSSTMPFDTGSGTKRAPLAGSGTSLVGIAAATQAQIEAESTIETIVMPSRMKFHPGVAKAWVKFDGTGSNPITKAAGYNIEGTITKNGAGDYTIAWDVNFSSANYAVVITAEGDVGGSNNVSFLQIKNAGQTAGSVRIQFLNNSGAAFDPPGVHVVAFGDQ